MEERHVPLSTVAGRLGVSERTVRRWIQAGKLKATRPGRDYRIPESAVQALIEEGEVSPKAPGRSSPEPTLFSELEDKRRRAFIEITGHLAAERAKHYERRLAEAQAGGVFAGHDGSRTLFEDAYLEYNDLRAELGTYLALVLAEDLPDSEAPGFARLAVATLHPLAETVERIADRAAELAGTEAQRAEVERRREEMRRSA
jgi:excisionase family DNA binding protein